MLSAGAQQRAEPFISHWFFDPTLALSVGCCNLSKSLRSAVPDKVSVARDLQPLLSSDIACPVLPAELCWEQDLSLPSDGEKSAKENVCTETKNRNLLQPHPLRNIR